MLKPNKLKNNQDGFAAIVIAIVLILILSLVTIGFAQLMRSNQEQALNKQLSSQAYYAAESGINDAVYAISQGDTTAKTSCDNSSVPPAYQSYFHSNVGDATGSSYTCLLINPAPSWLTYSSIDTNQPRNVEITPVESDGNTLATMDKLVIAWEDSGGGTTFTSSKCSGSSPTCFPPTTSWTNGGNAITGVLRMALTPITAINGTTSITRSSLINSTYTAFLYPAPGSGSTVDNYGSNIGNQAGNILNGNCNTAGNSTVPGTSVTVPDYCYVVVSNLGSINNASYVLDLRPIYGNVKVSIAAFDNSDKQLRISNAQYQIDSTGKAQSQLKRIQVTIPAHNNYPVPAYADQTGDSICKQLQLYPTGGSSSVHCP